MGYQRQTFENNRTTLQAEHLINIEDGILNNEAAIQTLDSDINDQQTGINKQITDLQNSVSTANGNITTLQVNMSEAQTNITAIGASAAEAVKISEQSLTDAQKAQARTNIGAANTNDTVAQGFVAGFIPLNVPATTESLEFKGVTITRLGNRITLNGTDTTEAGSLVTVRLTGALYARTGNLSAAQIAAGNVALPEKNNHIYKMSMRLISGTATYDADTPRLAGIASNTSMTGTKALVVNGNDICRDYYNYNGDGRVAVFMRYENGTVFTNAVYEVAVVDTETPYGLGNPVVEVSGTTATISAVEGVRYVCGTMEEISFTPCVRGLCEVIFTSGTTATVLTLPNTVKMPDWWTGPEVGRTYDIMVLNGTMGAVMSWTT